MNSTLSLKRPFFLYFASPANHTPYTPADKIGGQKVKDASQFVNGTLTGSSRLDFVYQNDVHIARLMKYLKTTEDPRRPGHKLIENTLFIFTSDNGSEDPSKVFTGPLRSNKGSVYEGGHRVPFFASWPLGGIGNCSENSKPKICDRLLSLTDMFATFAEVLEEPLPPLDQEINYGAEDSVSQLAALKGNECLPRIPVFPNDHMEATKIARVPERAWVAIRVNSGPKPGKWKLFLDHQWAWEQKPNAMELYNLENDPLEKNNLINDPIYKGVIEYLLKLAKLAVGENGSSRQMELKSPHETALFR